LVLKLTFYLENIRWNGHAFISFPAFNNTTVNTTNIFIIFLNFIHFIIFDSSAFLNLIAATSAISWTHIGSKLCRRDKSWYFPCNLLTWGVSFRKQRSAKTDMYRRFSLPLWFVQLPTTVPVASTSNLNSPWINKEINWAHDGEDEGTLYIIK
jgi:hypothetical protein